MPGFNDTIDFDATDMPWDAFKLQAPLPLTNLKAVVSGAGSSEVNGVYDCTGGQNAALECELPLGDEHRAFLLFHVAGTDWWNIQERVGSSYLKVHYGARGGNEHSSILPPSDGWGSTIYKDYWRGKAPHPTVKILENAIGRGTDEDTTRVGNHE